MCLGRLVRVLGPAGPGHVRALDGEREVVVSLLALPDLDDARAAVAGTWLLVHAGLALDCLTPAEAADALTLRGSDGGPCHDRRRTT